MKRVKLDFCPCEVGEGNKGYRKIDVEKLAYEMIFYDGYTYDTFKNAVKGTEVEKLLFTIGADKNQKDFNDGVTRYMMKEPKNGDEIGPKKLIAQIEKSKGKNLKKEVTEGGIFGELDEEDVFGDEKGLFGSVTEIPLECEEQEDGTYIVYDTSGRTKPFAELIPCCPNCHCRLPEGFLHADDYIGISLDAPAGGGKTTYVTSLYVDDFARMGSLGNGVVVIPAHYNASDVEIDSSSNSGKDIDAKGVDTFYEKRIKAARELVEEGICPEFTDAVHIIKPTFLRVIIPDENGGEKTLIVGIYDNSGEVLSESQSRNEKIIMLSNMYAQIYMVEPGQIGVQVSHKKKKAKGRKDKPVKAELLSLEEQGRFQQENAGVILRGEELLKKELFAEEIEEPEEDAPMTLPSFKKPMKLLVKLNRDMARLKFNNVYGKQHVAFTIIKCDQLEDMDAMKDYKILFENREVNTEVLWDDDASEAYGEFMRGIFDELVFSGPDGRMNQREFNSVRCRSYSWHMVSALGTGVVEDPESGRFKLEGEYDPIRVEEPLAACIIKRIKENGWAK